MIISMDSVPERRLLRFRAQLEVPKSYREDVIKVLPRVVDVLNSYLSALEVADLEDQAALTRLRAQMLRRVQVVTGQGRVNDFLIMEFVLT
jgi:flagellar FliL protein